VTGAILIANADARKQLPIPDVEITAQAGDKTAQTKSDSSGSFRLTWPAKILPGELVTLRFQHRDYEPLEIAQPLRNQLYVVRLIPSASATKDPDPAGTEIPIGDVRVRYSVKATNTVSVGSTSKTFEVVNTGNVPCQSRPPCSPDGQWKAAIGFLSLNAGDNQEFQNVRVSCIAGPCAFTKIESNDYAHGGPKVNISVRVWSDTVTFLVEAEVVRTMLNDAIRLAYPSVFGRAMTFTLPPAGEGLSIEAEVNGIDVVFPLGPELRLSWASCSAQIESNRTKLYSCKLEPGYRFL